MLLNCGDNKLFAKTVPVSIKDAHTNYLRQLFLTIEWQDSSNGLYNTKVLALSLTDNNDPFFLYNLLLSEEDFQMLKDNQDLLINFSSFPQHIIDYIEKSQSVQQEKSDQPKFMLMFILSDRPGGISSPSQFEIIEKNQFKQLTHLSLKFMAATDTDIKTYLISCFKSLKEERLRLQNRVNFLEHDTREKIAASEQTLNIKLQELDILKKDYERELKCKESQYNLDLQSEKNKLISEQTDKEHKMEREWKDKEHKLRKKIQELESKLSTIQTQNKDLEKKISKQDSTIRKLSGDILSLEEERNSLKKEVENNAVEIGRLKKENKEKSAHMNYQKNKIGELQEESNSKEQNVNMLKKRVTDVLNEKQSIEGDLARANLIIDMNEKSLKGLKEDLVRLNGVIAKLQKDVSAGSEKIKAKDKLLSKNAQVIDQKEALVQNMKTEVEEMKVILDAKNCELKSLKHTVTSQEERLHSLEEELKTRDNVVKWLNQQLTNRCVVPEYTPSSFGPSPSSVAQDQLSKIGSGQVSSAPDVSPSTNLPSKTSVSKLSQGRKSIPSPNQLKSKITPTRLHSTGATDSAYCASPHELSNPISPITPSSANKVVTEEEYDIDPAVLDAAFGTSDNRRKSATKNMTKSVVSKFLKKR